MAKFIALYMLCPCCEHEIGDTAKWWCHAKVSCRKTTTINAKGMVSCRGLCHQTVFKKCKWRCNKAQHKDFT
eukprot:UN05004